MRVSVWGCASVRASVCVYVCEYQAERERGEELLYNVQMTGILH